MILVRPIFRNLFIPLKESLANTEFLKRFPFYSFPLAWNNLPNNLKDISSKKLFRINLKQKELSFCHKLWFSNSYNLGTHFPRPLIFQTINYVSSNSLSLKYQRFTPSGCKDIGIKNVILSKNSIPLIQTCLNYQCNRLFCYVCSNV